MDHCELFKDWPTFFVCFLAESALNLFKSYPAIPPQRFTENQTDFNFFVCLQQKRREAKQRNHSNNEDGSFKVDTLAVGFLLEWIWCKGFAVHLCHIWLYFLCQKHHQVSFYRSVSSKNVSPPLPPHPHPLWFHALKEILWSWKCCVPWAEANSCQMHKSQSSTIEPTGQTPLGGDLTLTGTCPSAQRLFLSVLYL